MKLGFLGAGKMATALARGLVQSGVCAAEDMVAADISEAARATFSETVGVAVTESAEDMVRRSEVVVLAVKPQHAAEAVTPIRDRCAAQLIVSIMAGVTLDTLHRWFDSQRVVRTMPNTPAMVGVGAAAFCCGSAVTDADRDTVRAVLEAVGLCVEVAESDMDAVTAVSGTGPAYVFELIQAMVDGAVEIGLGPDVALELVGQTVVGAAEMVRRKLGSPDQLRVAVTSPGGTTAAGLKVMRARDFRQVIAQTIRAARDRSVELGKNRYGMAGA